MSCFKTLRAARAASLLIILNSALSSAAGAEKVALVGGRIIPVVGDEIGKGTILIERGKIVWSGLSAELAGNTDVQHRYLGV